MNATRQNEMFLPFVARGRSQTQAGIVGGSDIEGGRIQGAAIDSGPGPELATRSPHEQQTPGLLLPTYAQERPLHPTAIARWE